MLFRKSGKKDTENKKAEKKKEKFDIGRRDFIKAGFLGTIAAVSLSLFAKIPLASAFGIVTNAELKNYSESVNVIGSIGGGTQDIDLTLGNVVTGTVDTSATTFTFSNPPASGKAGSFTLILTNGGSQTVTWPASVDWADGSAPTLTTSGVDVLSFVTTDGGTTWRGFAPGLNMS